MRAAEILEHALALVGGQLDRGDGVVVAPGSAVSVVAPGDPPERIRKALEGGGRAAIPIALDAPGRLAHLAELLLARWRIASARRRLAAAGAMRIRAVGVVPGDGMLQLVYELGPRVQHYVEEHVVLESSDDPPLMRRLKRLLGRVGGVSASVALVIVVGDRP